MENWAGASDPRAPSEASNQSIMRPEYRSLTSQRLTSRHQLQGAWAAAAGAAGSSGRGQRFMSLMVGA